MACRDTYQTKKLSIRDAVMYPVTTFNSSKNIKRLFFGVDASASSQIILQNNINMFDWIVRNKIHPNFFGRNIMGKNHLTKEEIDFLHSKACLIAPTISNNDPKETELQGKLLANQVFINAMKLNIPAGVAVFLEIVENEEVTCNYMRGYAMGLLEKGYTPAFKANTDAKFSFDREFSKGMQADREIFEQCLIWAVAPTMSEYNSMTTTHLIHPDQWKPYAPSSITRNDIAIWQYGIDCHPIEDNCGNTIKFNMNLVHNANVILEKMF